MNVTINQELIKKSCDYFGKEDTLTVAMEECAELIQCVSKELRGQEALSHMEEEIGDVLIGISDLVYILHLDEDKIQRWIDFKQNRQVHRIRE